MKSRFSKGFTLIELLVVIAIIGILSSVVLASLNKARDRGNDAKVKAQLAGARSAAELYNDTVGGYGTATDACDNMFADTASSMATYADDTKYPAGTTITCRSVGTGYALTGSLKGGGFWCIDATGVSQAITTNLATGDATCN